MGGGEPALFPLPAALKRPIFLIIKLEPMKMLEERAITSPITLSLDLPMMYQNNKKIIIIILKRLWINESSLQGLDPANKILKLKPHVQGIKKLCPLSIKNWNGDVIWEIQIVMLRSCLFQREELRRNRQRLIRYLCVPETNDKYKPQFKSPLLAIIKCPP